MYDGQFHQPLTRSQTPVFRQPGTGYGDSASSKKTGASTSETENEPLNVFSSVNEFESALSNLIDSISTFKPNEEHAERLIEADLRFSSSVEDLVQHQQIGKQIKQVKAVSDELDNQLNALLVGLSDCRRSLNSVPNLAQEELIKSGLGKNYRKQVPADELLKYATRITKFTHAPPGYDPNIPEHANLPWPTEDELRRGVLAMSAMMDSQIADINTPSNETKKIQAKQTAGVSQSPTIIVRRRRSSVVEYGERPVIDPSAAPTLANSAGPAKSAVLDLDLFDPDEDEE
jgi:mediator of RNA polymerase II transcription subunit 4